MPITADELVRLLAMLAEEEKLKVTVRETLKGGAMAGTGAVIGGFLGGPIGIAVGGSLGAVAGAYATQGKFKSVPEVLTDMDRGKKEQLYQQFQNLICGLDFNDINTLKQIVALDGDFKMKMVSGLKDFIEKEMKMEIID